MIEGEKILIVGADGFIGSALAKHLSLLGTRPWKTTRRKSDGDPSRIQLDLSTASDSLLPANIKVSFLLAGETSTAKCRAYPSETSNVNVEATEALARRLVEAGSRVIFLSSNLVFDGSVPLRSSNDPTCPKTEYGERQRAEQRLLSLGDGVTVVRLTKVFSRATTLLREWSDSLRSGKTIRPLCDLVVAPIALDFVILVLSCLIDIPHPGIMQVSAEYDVTYATIAKTLCEQLAASPELVRSAWAKDSDPELEHLPAYSTLDASTLKTTFGLPLPDFWSFLQ